VRSNGLLAAISGALVLGSACGGDGGTPPVENTAPVASFAVPACTINVACDFASTSTDDAAVTAWSWDFDGDGTADATTATASFTYTAAGTFDVTLTVRDAEGLSGTKTSSITIDPEGSPPPPPDNPAPTASFDFSCTDADCSFTSTSADAAPGTIVSYAWDFGDGAVSDLPNPSHSYSVTASTDFTVSLTVTDNEGATDVVTYTVTVAPAPVPNTPPTAGFTHTCDAEDCSFTSTSTDVPPGTITGFAWEFGDGGTANVANPSHSYAVVNPTDFTVKLTVTDDQGATDVETQTITVSPPPPGAEGCTTVGTRIECLLDITSRSTIKLKLLGVSCSLDHQRITIPAPIGDQVFLGVCSRVAGDSTKIFGGPADTAIVFEPGSQVHIKFNQGTPGAGEPTPAAPSAHFLGSFPNWTIEFEDGQNPGGPGEPDFADVVLGVTAVPFP
jgi:PKD repeat protein